MSDQRCTQRFATWILTLRVQSHFYFISTSRPWYHLVAKNQGFSTSILLPCFRVRVGSAFFKLGFRDFDFKLISSSRQGYHLVAKNHGFQTSIYEWSLSSRVHPHASFSQSQQGQAICCVSHQQTSASVALISTLGRRSNNPSQSKSSLHISGRSNKETHSKHDRI